MEHLDFEKFDKITEMPTEKSRRDYLMSTVTPRQRRMIERMVQLNKTWDKLNEDYLERFGCPDTPVSNRSFVEKPFGYAASDDSLLTSSVVSLALYDGDKMLFACSGVALGRKGRAYPVVSRFVTSKRLVTEFEKNRNRADNLRVGAANHSVLSFGFVFQDLHSHIGWQNDLVAYGRAFSSGILMATSNAPTQLLGADHLIKHDLIPFPCPVTEAGLGGPVINEAGDVVGLSIKVDVDEETTYFLHRVALLARLEYLEKLMPNSTNFREYTLPDGVNSIVPSGVNDRSKIPEYSYVEVDFILHISLSTHIGHFIASGFMAHVNYLKSCGYPQPPPLVLEVNGRLLNTFEEDFGQLYGYEDCDSNFYDRSSEEQIKVLLPPKQVVDGTLELYHSDYNIAVISLQKPLYGIRPEYIFRTAKRPPRVVAIGRGAQDGLLMGTIGKAVKKLAGDKLPCEDLKLSTCKITKVGIGGPLVNIVNGLFAGMNFYGETDVTPYLPRAIIVEVLSGTDLPSHKGMDHATDIMGAATVKKNRIWTTGGGCLSHIGTIPYLKIVVLYIFMEGNSSNPIYRCASSTA
uniref:Uncharacterized protein n=1 Tax=Aegilops tauschii TaxID=37682 RepID=M8BLY2_AEGTA